MACENPCRAAFSNTGRWVPLRAKIAFTLTVTSPADSIIAHNKSGENDSIGTWHFGQ